MNSLFIGTLLSRRTWFQYFRITTSTCLISGRQSSSSFRCCNALLGGFPWAITSWSAERTFAFSFSTESLSSSSMSSERERRIRLVRMVRLEWFASQWIIHRTENNTTDRTIGQYDGTCRGHRAEFSGESSVQTECYRRRLSASTSIRNLPTFIKSSALSSTYSCLLIARGTIRFCSCRQ